MANKKPRKPNDFDPTKEIYFLGVPLNYPDKKKFTDLEFVNLIKRAKKENWPFFSTSTKKGFYASEVNGFKYIEEQKIIPQDISWIWGNNRSGSGKKAVTKIIKLAKFFKVPLVVLRHGSPYVGDFIVWGCQRELKQEVEILDTRSGPDLVADIAEKLLDTKKLKRQHYHCQYFLTLDKEKIKGKLVIINCINHIFYIGPKNKKSMLHQLADYLIDNDLGDKTLFLKKPKEKGEVLSGWRFKAKIKNYDPFDNYTLVIFKNKKYHE